MDELILSPKTFAVFSLGCRTNEAEIEDLSQQLIKKGFTPASGKEQPGLVVLNTCVVTQKAEKETRQKIRELRKKYPQSFLVVLGCAVTAKEKLGVKLPKADLFIPNEDKEKALKIILKKISFSKDTKNNLTRQVFWTKYQSSGRKFIKIQDGCNKFCAYCLTCLVRGKPKSVPGSQIIKEINFWVDKGIKEIILTGINISLWGKDLQPQEKIEDLIEKILSETKAERISFSSVYPEMINKKITKLVVGNPRISQYFHLSLQSGSEEVLKRMGRPTDLKSLLEKINLIKKANPLFTFRADIIVGFPQETEKEFKETIDFLQRAKIAFGHVFPFSARKGTLAEKKICQGEWKEVPFETKKQREKEIIKELREIRKKEIKKQLGRKTKCLIVAQKKGKLWGLTQNNWQVMLENQENANLKGKLVEIEIFAGKTDYLLGRITSLPTN